MGLGHGSSTPAGAEPIPAHLPQADAAGQALAEVSGGEAFGTYMDSVVEIGATAHILGGAAVGPDPVRGGSTPTIACSATRDCAVWTDPRCQPTSA